ncbi:MAG: hypothetical protein JO112_09960, partial [Planctomycetes bacterium]|nr:hypothetical protein [Planctomycetota bacterium]
MNPLPVVIPPALSSPPRAADGVDLQAQVYQATCAAPRPLGGLMPWVVERRNLTAAWQRVSAADGADTPGPDGQTCTGLRSQVGTWLARL